MVVKSLILWPVLAVYQWGFNYLTLMNVKNPLFSKELDVCKVHVIAGCFNSSETDVAADDLNI